MTVTGLVALFIGRAIQIARVVAPVRIRDRFAALAAHSRPLPPVRAPLGGAVQRGFKRRTQRTAPRAISWSFE
jgi:hypothetical protein